MGIIRNILALIGLLALLTAGYLYFKVTTVMGEFDPDAPKLYQEFMGKLLETKDLASAMVWQVPVEEGIEPEDVKESMKSLAVERNFLFVGESPFYKQAQAVTGKPFRHVSFMQFCDAQVGIQMANYNNAYTALMPCTISVVEDQQGKLWLYSLNIDFLIHGARELPPDLKQAALKVRRTIREIMEGAAAGEF